MRKFTDNILKGEKLEFGNPQQIKLIQEHERYERRFLDGEIDLDSEEVSVNVTYNIDFKCPECGNKHVSVTYKKKNCRTETHFEAIHYYEETICYDCGTKFTISKDGILYMIENKRHPEKLPINQPLKN